MGRRLKPPRAMPGWTRNRLPTRCPRTSAICPIRWVSVRRLDPYDGGKTQASCAELWRRIAANGHIYLGHYEGRYAVRDEAFYDEEELTARPDGSKVAPSGAPVEWVREPSYFLDLSKWQDKLLELYETQPDFIAPTSRRNEVMSFVRSAATRPIGQPDQLHLGHPGTGCAGARHVRLGGCAEQRLHRAAVSPIKMRNAGHSGRRMPTSLARTSSGSTPSYWPALLMAAGLPIPKRVTPTAGGRWTARRCPSRSATS